MNPNNAFSFKRLAITIMGAYALGYLFFHFQGMDLMFPSSFEIGLGMGLLATVFPALLFPKLQKNKSWPIFGWYLIGLSIRFLGLVVLFLLKEMLGLSIHMLVAYVFYILVYFHVEIWAIRKSP